MNMISLLYIQNIYEQNRLRASWTRIPRIPHQFQDYIINTIEKIDKFKFAGVRLSFCMKQNTLIILYLFFSLIIN